MVHHVPKIQYGGAKPIVFKPFVVICGSHHILSYRTHRPINKIPTATHILEVQLFSGVINDVTGSRIIPEIDMAAAQYRK